MASKYYLGFGVDGVEEVVKLCREAHAEFPHVVFFVSKLVFENETWITRLLHNQIVYAIHGRTDARLGDARQPLRTPQGAGSRRSRPWDVIVITSPRMQRFWSLGPHGFDGIGYTEWGDLRNPHLVVCVHGLTRNCRDFDVYRHARLGGTLNFYIRSAA
jgi:hypothetical protein